MVVSQRVLGSTTSNPQGQFSGVFPRNPLVSQEVQQRANQLSFSPNPQCTSHDTNFLFMDFSGRRGISRT